MKSIWFLFLSYVLFPLGAFTQNLLLNGDFEKENICSEYKINCAPEAWIYTVPSFIYYFTENKMAHSGQHFVALVAGHATKHYYRTFVRSKLLCGLRKGKTYRLEFYVKSVHPILDSIGIYFSSDDFLFENRPYKSIHPSMYLNDAKGKVMQDTGWQFVRLDYVADGDEVYITIGNFSRRDITGSTGIVLGKKFFVLFDDISLKPLDPLEGLCDNWQEAQEQIYGQDERHEYLQRLIKINKGKPLTKEAIPKTIVQKIDTFVVPDILFDVNSYFLNRQAYRILDSFVRQHFLSGIDSLVVEGHTDSFGSDSANKKLSQNRASAIADYLRPHYTAKIQTRGWGREKPLADNSTSAGRQQNRRVEIYFYMKE